MKGDVSTLLTRIDKLLYQAWLNGRAQVAIYDEPVYTEVQELHALIAALTGEEIPQPCVDCRTRLKPGVACIHKEKP